jgi:hypothetical protein
MKDAAEKVSIIYTITPTHFHPEIGSMVGDMVSSFCIAKKLRRVFSPNL